MDYHYLPEKVYDRCAYLGCSNGKESGHHLFRFPLEKDPRRAVWIENTGNVRLSRWSASTIRRAGLCRIHFTPGSFIIGNDMKLSPAAVPLRYDPNIDQTGDVCETEQNDLDVATVVQDLEPMEFQVTEPVEDHGVTGQKRNSVLRVYEPAQLNFSDEDDEKLEWTTIEAEERPTVETSPPKIEYQKHVSKPLNRIVKVEKALKSIQRQNKMLRQSVRKLREQLKRALRRSMPREKKGAEKERTVDDFLDEHNCDQPAARTMVKLQLHKPRAPYSPEEKDLAKQLYYYSASAYSRLRKAGCNFPGESTVRRWIAEYDIRCGFSDCIFEKLAQKLALLPPDERICALKWDEMSIKSFEEYSRMQHQIEGLHDLGTLGRKNERAKNLFVFCVDSVNAKNPWRQPLAYFVTSTVVKGEEIEELVRTCLDKLKTAGADVRILTCDQGTSNQMALMSPLHFNISETNQAFQHNGSTYYASFDFPHLIKRLLYQLRKHDVIYCDGTAIVAFKDFIETWRMDSRNNTSNLLGHISEAHMFPGTFQSMNVKRAFQVLSHTFASAIKLAGSDPNGLQSKTWEASAAFAEYMNGIIDAHNAYRLIFANPKRRPLSDRNPSIETDLLDFAEWASKWSVSPTKIQRAPCFKRLVITAHAIVKTYHQVKGEFPEFELAAGLCNQDSVEHLFSKLRQRGGHNPNPTVRMARLALRHIISTGYVHTSDKGNVQCPEARSLINPCNDIIRAFSELEESAADVARTYEDNIEDAELKGLIYDLKVLEENGGLATTQNTKKSLYENNAVTFFAGYIAFKMMKKTPCDKCQNDMTKTPMDGSTAEEMYIEFREYENLDEDAPKVTKLTRPTDMFAKLVDVQLFTFSKTWFDFWPSASVDTNLIQQLMTATKHAYPQWFSAEEPCLAHRVAALEFLVTVKLHARARSNNQMVKERAALPQSKNRKLKNLKNQ